MTNATVPMNIQMQLADEADMLHGPFIKRAKIFYMVCPIKGNITSHVIDSINYSGDSVDDLSMIMRITAPGVTGFLHVALEDLGVPGHAIDDRPCLAYITEAGARDARPFIKAYYKAHWPL